MTLKPTPSTSQYIDIDDLRFHYLDFGDIGLPPGEDPRVKALCLHGGAAQAHWFDFVVGPLIDKYRVLSLDLRGHGDSDWGPPDQYNYLDFAKDTGDFIEKLGIGPVLLMGHSMGGMVSIVTAAEYPETVGMLVVIDSMMRMSHKRAAELRTIGTGKGKAFESREAYVEGFKIRPETISAAPEVTRHMAACSCREFEDGQWRNKFDRNVYAQRHPIEGYTYWAKIGGAKTQALVIAGSHSNRITQEVRKNLLSAHPAISFSTVENAGHHVTLDNPAGFVDALTSHLSETAFPKINRGQSRKGE
ncbi:MAG: alpha/beta hydrolase [Pseudomonadota bacterium]